MTTLKFLGLRVLIAVVMGAPVPALAQSTDTYTYDVLGRAVTVTRADGKQTTYTYDAAGNRTQKVTASAGAPTVAAISQNVAHNTATAISLLPSAGYTSVAIASGPSHGSTSLSGTVVTYTPTTGYSGSDSFAYTATGPGGTSSAATVTLTVASNNQAPNCYAKTIDLGYIPNYGYGVSTSLTAIQHYPACTDPDGDPLTIVSVSNFTNSAYGSVTSSDTLQINNILPGGTTFTYGVTDGQGHTIYATFTFDRSS